jgi:hypothetical protein
MVKINRKEGKKKNGERVAYRKRLVLLVKTVLYTHIASVSFVMTKISPTGSVQYRAVITKLYG